MDLTASVHNSLSETALLRGNDPCDRTVNKNKALIREIARAHTIIFDFLIQ